MYMDMIRIRETQQQTMKTANKQIRDVCETLMPPLDIHFMVHKPLLWARMETANY
jgi:hypothetical protein